MKPKVSIVVPLYNVEDYIERCARSLFRQTFTDVEYIFVDDSCQDKTMDLLKGVISDLNVQQKVKICSHEQNEGLAAARLAGLLMATGKYVVQVDSDDYVEMDYVEQLVNEAERTCSDIVICDYYQDYGDRKTICHVNPPAEVNKCQELLMSGQMHNAVWNKLIRRSLYVDNGIKPIPGFNIFEDKIAMFQLFYFAKRVSYVNKPLYYYNRTNCNSITSQDKSKLIQPAIGVIRLLQSFYSDKVVDENVSRAIVYFKISIMGLILLYGTKEQLEANRQLFGNPTVQQVMSQPVVPFYYKWAVIAYIAKVPLLFKPIKMTLRLLNHFPALKRKLAYSASHQ